MKLRTNRSKLAAAVILALTLAPPALAHQGGHHVRGTVKEITAERLVITERPGKDMTFSIVKSTTFLRGKTPVRWEDVKAGERAVIHGGTGAASGTAAEVMLGSAPPAR